jgi:phospholipid/cholesterol/gamma-HCH transport system substrate-binding protein
MKKSFGFTWKLGAFVMIGLALFIVTIYFVGKQKNLFGSTFHLKSQFKNVSGLKVGNNVRFSGINVGTVNEIELITDTSVMVDLIIRKKYQQFIKTDARASIGSDGLMGDKVLTISPGISQDHIAKNQVKNNYLIASKNAVEMEDVMSSMKTSVDNAGIITAQLAQFTTKMNNGNGALSKLISDEAFSTSLQGTVTNLQTSAGEFAKFTTKMNDGKGALSKLISDEAFSNSLQGTLTNLQTSSSEFAKFTTNMNDGKFSKSLDSTMSNIQGATKGLNENMQAAQHNFLLKGFFKKKKKAEAKKLAELKKQEDTKKKNDLKSAIGEKEKDSLLNAKGGRK